MAGLTATPDRYQAQYRGVLAEPVFSVLGDPAKLYTNLLRRLQPFGATTTGLNINVSVLSQANVTCFLPAGLVKIGIDQVEMVLRDLTDLVGALPIFEAFLGVLADTDPTLWPVRHELTLAVWAQLKEEPFSSFIQRIVTVPTGLAGSVPRIEFQQRDDVGQVRGSILLEESAITREALFTKSVHDLGPAVHSATLSTELVTTFLDRVEAQLQAVGVNMELPR